LLAFLKEDNHIRDFFVRLLSHHIAARNKDKKLTLHTVTPVKNKGKTYFSKYFVPTIKKITRKSIESRREKMFIKEVKLWYNNI
jgi:hypothetical protein